MSGSAQTLVQYARRRFSLAGAGVLSEFNPYFAAVDVLRRQCEASGLKFLNFAQYDYLGIGAEDRAKVAASEALHEFGMGAGASRLVGGEWSVHRLLEQDLARFVGTEDSLAMVSGYGANLALVGHLLATGDLIVVDEYSHNSIMLGTALSRADVKTFAHNDLDELAAILVAARGSYRRVLVVIEGLYSMEGDFPDLPRLVDLCERHAAWLMIDEAHSIGVLGQSGRGICEHFGVDPQRIDLIVGTLSKALTTCGGFICAKAPVIEWLRYTLPGFVYSVGLPPPIAAAVRSALATIEAEPRRVRQLQEISAYFVDRARSQGFDVGSAMGAGVVPVKFADAPSTMAASKVLMDAGIYVPPVVQQGVPKDMPRLRFFLSARHTREDVDRVFAVLASWRDEAAAKAVRRGKKPAGATASMAAS